MLVGVPAGEPVEIAQDPLARRAENVRPVPVDENAVLIAVIVHVAGDVGPLLDDEDALAEPGGKALRHDGTSKAGADHDSVECGHHAALASRTDAKASSIMRPILSAVYC